MAKAEDGGCSGHQDRKVWLLACYESSINVHAKLPRCSKGRVGAHRSSSNPTGALRRLGQVGTGLLQLRRRVTTCLRKHAHRLTAYAVRSVGVCVQWHCECTPGASSVCTEPPSRRCVQAAAARRGPAPAQQRGPAAAVAAEAAGPAPLHPSHSLQQPLSATAHQPPASCRTCCAREPGQCLRCRQSKIL